MKHGLVMYGTILHKLRGHPTTARGVARRHGLGPCSARATMRQFLELGLVRIVGYRRVGAAGVADRVFGVGAGPNAPPPLTDGKPGRARPIRIGRVQPSIIAFAVLWRALEAPLCATEIADETGIGLQALYRFFNGMRAVAAVRIADWQSLPSAVPIGLYQLGRGPDAPRPTRATSAVVNRRRRARDRALRMVHRMAGVVA